MGIEMISYVVPSCQPNVLGVRMYVYNHAVVQNHFLQHTDRFCICHILWGRSQRLSWSFLTASHHSASGGLHPPQSQNQKHTIMIPCHGFSCLYHVLLIHLQCFEFCRPLAGWKASGTAGAPDFIDLVQFFKKKNLFNAFPVTSLQIL